MISAVGRRFSEVPPVTWGNRRVISGVENQNGTIQCARVANGVQRLLVFEEVFVKAEWMHQDLACARVAIFQAIGLTPRFERRARWKPFARMCYGRKQHHRLQSPPAGFGCSGREQRGHGSAAVSHEEQWPILR